MGISDVIAGFIQEVLEDADGCCELQRAELASRFGCVPSQINYVISTRFSPEHGYLVESRRGGGGYIRITRVRMDRVEILMHTVNAIGQTLDHRTARAFLSNLLGAGAVEPRTAGLMASAVGENAMRVLPAPYRDAVRASILKQMLVHILQAES